MRVLIVGGGGREHALAWKCAQSQALERIYVAPGNAGTGREPRVQNVALASDNIDALVDFAQASAIDLTIVGPEAPLLAGIVDAFQAAGLACFGPDRAAAQLEGSKTFTKEFLIRHRIPTARYRAFTDPDAAASYIREQGAPIVIKADGLAAGKGVVLAPNVNEAIAATRAMLSGEAFGAAGRRIIVEELLRGEEASFIVMADGRHALPMATSQDHKARDAGDLGPNTGGMGAYSPAPVVTDALHARIMDEVIGPTVAGMASDGHPYTGFLYAGLMIEDTGTPRVLEFNCRLGDPEAQPILMRLRSDLPTLCLAAIAGRLGQEPVAWDPRAALGVVVAAGGYPGHYEQGHVIDGLPTDDSAEAKVFHAGTRKQQGRVLTAGGRVLCGCALGVNVGAAQRAAYDLVAGISWPGAFYRPDIGARAVRREQAMDEPPGA